MEGVCPAGIVAGQRYFLAARTQTARIDVLLVGEAQYRATEVYFETPPQPTTAHPVRVPGVDFSRFCSVWVKTEIHGHFIHDEPGCFSSISLLTTELTRRCRWATPHSGHRGRPDDHDDVLRAAHIQDEKPFYRNGSPPTVTTGRDSCQRRQSLLTTIDGWIDRRQGIPSLP